MIARLFNAYVRTSENATELARLAWVAVGGVSLWIARKVSRNDR